MDAIDKSDLFTTVRRCVYFPFVSVKESAIRQFLTCFHHITLYQPVGAGSLPDVKPWLEKGVLEFRTPFEGITDRKHLLDQLKHWKAWIRSRSQQDLAYLKVMKDEIGPVHPVTPEVVSEVKAMTDMKDDGSQQDLACQLFLLLSQEWDVQFQDLNEHLETIKHQYQSLQSFFRVDSFEDEDMADFRVVDPVLTEVQEERGAKLTEKQVASWNHLFQKDPVAPSVLLTDSSAVFDTLIEDIQGIIEISVPAEAARHDASDILPLPELLTSRWDKDMKERVTKVQKKTAENRIHSEEPSVRFVLIPNVPPTTFLNDRCGGPAVSVSSEASPNTVL